MVSSITSKIINSKVLKRVPYVGPVIQGVAIVLDIKEIVQSSTPIGAAKIIAGRFSKKYRIPQVFLAGNCVMFLGGVVASIGPGGNPILLTSTILAGRSIIKDL